MSRLVEIGDRAFKIRPKIIFEWLGIKKFFRPLLMLYILEPERENG